MLCGLRLWRGNEVAGLCAGIRRDPEAGSRGWHACIVKRARMFWRILCAEWGMRGSRRACVTGWVGLPSGEGYRESKLVGGRSGARVWMR